MANLLRYDAAQDGKQGYLDALRHIRDLGLLCGRFQPINDEECALVKTGGRCGVPTIRETDDGYVFSFNVVGYGGRAVYKVDDVFLADLDNELAGWRRHILSEIAYRNGE